MLAEKKIIEVVLADECVPQKKHSVVHLSTPTAPNETFVKHNVRVERIILLFVIVVRQRQRLR